MPPTNPTVIQDAPSSAHSPKLMIQNTAAGLFIACVAVLSAISIFGVWDIFNGDVIFKSFETLGLLAVVAIVVIVASNFVGDPSVSTVPVATPGFRAVRNVTLATLIASSAILAFLGVLSIWEVISDKKVLAKSLSSLAIVAFSSLIIVIMSLEREKNPLWAKRNVEISGGAIFASIIFIYIMFAFMFS